MAKAIKAAQIRKVTKADNEPVITPEMIAASLAGMKAFGEREAAGKSSRYDSAWYFHDQCVARLAGPADAPAYAKAYDEGRGTKDGPLADKSRQTFASNLANLGLPQVVAKSEELKKAFAEFKATPGQRDGSGGFSRAATGKDIFGCLHTLCGQIGRGDPVAERLTMASIAQSLRSVKKQADDKAKEDAKAQAEKDATDPQKIKERDESTRKTFVECFKAIRPAELDAKAKKLVEEFNKTFGVALA